MVRALALARDRRAAPARLARLARRGVRADPLAREGRRAGSIRFVPIRAWQMPRLRIYPLDVYFVSLNYLSTVVALISRLGFFSFVFRAST